MNDIELAEAISRDIGKEYELALDFMSLDPKTALYKFRAIAELLCLHIARINNIEFSEDNLFTWIKELHDCQLFSKPLMDRFHKVRSAGNIGVHSSEDSVESEKDMAEMIVNHNKELKKLADKTRTDIIEILEDVHRILHSCSEIRQIKKVELTSNHWQFDLARCTLSENWESKKKAGYIYYSLAEKMRSEDPYNSTSAFQIQYSYYMKMAAISYEGAILSSFDVNENEIFEKSLLLESCSDILKSDYYTDQITKYSDTESMVQFYEIGLSTDSIAEYFNGRDAFKSQYFWMIKAAAERGHPKALAFYGSHFLEKGNEVKAEKYLKQSCNKNSDLGMATLAIHYSNKDSNEARNNSLALLEKGVALGGEHCLYAYAVLLHIQENHDEAKDYLLKSIKAGSLAAAVYYREHYLIKEARQIIDDFLEENKDVFKSVVSGMFSALQKNIPTKIRANDPCPCNSGKKYMKCCRIK